MNTIRPKSPHIASVHGLLGITAGRFFSWDQVGCHSACAILYLHQEESTTHDEPIRSVSGYGKKHPPCQSCPFRISQEMMPSCVCHLGRHFSIDCFVPVLRSFHPRGCVHQKSSHAVVTRGCRISRQALSLSVCPLPAALHSGFAPSLLSALRTPGRGARVPPSSSGLP